MTRASERWGLWRVMSLYWVAQAAIGFFGWPLLVWDFDPRTFWLSPRYAWGMGGVLLLMMMLQATLVMPPASRRSEVGLPAGRSDTIAMCAALGGLAAYGVLWLLLGIAPALRFELTHELALLCTGGAFVLVLVSSWLVVWATSIGHSLWVRLRSAVLGLAGAHVIVGLLAGLLALAPVQSGETLAFSASATSAAVLLLAQWAICTVFAQVAGDRGRGDGRWFVMAVLGTAALGVVVLFPLDLVMRDKNKWYLDSGTLWGVTLCGSAALLVGGPAIWMAVLAARRKGKEMCCTACGYEMSGCKSAARCPECGAKWRSAEPVLPALVGAFEAELDRAALGSAEGQGVEVGGVRQQS